MNRHPVHTRIVQIAGLLVLVSLLIQFLIFEAADVPGYWYWAVLVGFVALVIVLAPVAWKRDED